MKTAPKVIIIILNWNNISDTLCCLESVFKSDYRNFRVIVIDNGSINNPKEILNKSFPQVIFIRNQENLGYTGGNNLGIKNALLIGAEYVWLLNNDTTVEYDSLSKLISVAKDALHIGLLSPTIINGSGNNESKYIGTYLNKEKIIKNNFKSQNELLETEKIEPLNIALWGTALMIKRELINTIGCLDDQYFAYYEDMDYSARSTSAGFFNKLDLGTTIFHKRERQTNGYHPAHYYFFMTRNKYLFWMKHLEPSKKKLFKRQFIADTLRKAAHFKEMKNEKAMRACLDGLYCALKNKFGVRHERDKMPEIFTNLLILQPYLIIKLIAPNK